ncbi:YqeG family HAD IIIA-type phosphatase [bacterium]|nr:YqeG family HAD IIIA-type phosphatase [bacterium]
MFLKPDYNLKKVFDIPLEELKNQGIKAMLFDLDSTLMASRSGKYTEEVSQWLEIVKKDFFVAVVSNNTNEKYIEKVTAASDFPVLFKAKKPHIKCTKSFLEKYGIDPKCAAIAGDRPLTDILCGKRLGCKTILVDAINAEVENLPTRAVRKLERICIRK